MPHLCGETHGTPKRARACPETRLVSGYPKNELVNCTCHHIGRSASGRLSKTRRVASTDRPRRSFSQLQGPYDARLRPAPWVRFRNYFHALSPLKFSLRYDTAVLNVCIFFSSLPVASLHVFNPILIFLILVGSAFGLGFK